MHKPETLRQKLALPGRLGNPAGEVLESRRRLCEFLREVEGEVFAADEETTKEIRTLLGWDDETLQRFCQAPVVTQSSPHVSMNLFSPNIAHPWLHGAMQSLPENRAEGKRPIHLRTLVSNNNFGDLKYKTYGWWHRALDGSVQQAVLSARGHSVRHRTLLSQPIPRIDETQLHEVDRQALRLAKSAKNMAYFCMIFRCSIERAAGLHEDRGLLDVPLNILTAWTFQTEDPRKWSAHFGPMRTIDAKGELSPMDDTALENLNPERLKRLNEVVLVAPNYMNFAQAYRFGLSAMTGGPKMRKYVPEMNPVIESFFAQDGRVHSAPQLIALTSVPADRIVPIDEKSGAFLKEKGITGCLSIGCVDHGVGIRRNLDRLLDAEYSSLSA
jgi:hypothetical protein